MNSVLLTVSGVIDPHIEEKIARGERPMADYLAMAEAFGADLLDYAIARQSTGRVGRWLERIGGPDLVLAWACFTRRHDYQTCFTDGEQVGLPLALFLKMSRSRLRHLMIVHILSVRKKMFFLDWFRAQSRIDRFFVYATWQKRFIEERWHIPAERVIWTPFMVDTDFFSPQKAGQVDLQLGLDHRPVICAVGLEFRDYPTLLEAVDGLAVNVVIAAASPWSKREDSTTGRKIPENVLVSRFTQFELRELYALSDFMVMPLENVPFQAGVTAILEAMAMGKAVICSKTIGQTDVIIDGKTGIYVPPQDVSALRREIRQLIEQPQETKRMGAAGRELVLQSMNLHAYASRLAEYVK
jgi:glycosyltransferase involved in cell wall biosynthesis